MKVLAVLKAFLETQILEMLLTHLGAQDEN